MHLDHAEAPASSASARCSSRGLGALACSGAGVVVAGVEERHVRVTPPAVDRESPAPMPSRPTQHVQLTCGFWPSAGTARGVLSAASACESSWADVGRARSQGHQLGQRGHVEHHRVRPSVERQPVADEARGCPRDGAFRQRLRLLQNKACSCDFCDLHQLRWCGRGRRARWLQRLDQAAHLARRTAGRPAPHAVAAAVECERDCLSATCSWALGSP